MSNQYTNPFSGVPPEALRNLGGDALGTYSPASRLESPSLVTALDQRELDRLATDYPGHRLIGRNPTGYILFEHDGDLFMLLQDGQVQRNRGWFPVAGVDGRPCTVGLVVSPLQAEILDRRYPGWDVVGRDSSHIGHDRILFTDDGVLHQIDNEGHVDRLEIAVEVERGQPAARLDLPYEAIRHQDIPGGVLVTFLRVMMPPAGIVGAKPQIMPMGTTFLPDVYIADAVDSAGNRGMFAVKIGVALEALGLKPFEAPMGGMVMR